MIVEHNGVKVCTKCGEIKPLCDFYERSDHPGKYKSQCKQCYNDGYEDYRKLKSEWRKEHGPRSLEGIKKRFWSKVDMAGDCWLWTASLTGDGYGRFGINGKLYLAHRLAYEWEYGPISDNLIACHRCDVNYDISDPTYRRCVRPDHIFLGTVYDNVHDMIDKGRQCNGDRMRGFLPERYGVECSSAKLTEDIVQQIRRMRVMGMLLKDISEITGVNIHTVEPIVYGYTWKHLPIDGSIPCRM